MLCTGVGTLQGCQRMKMKFRTPVDLPSELQQTYYELFLSVIMGNSLIGKTPLFESEILGSFPGSPSNNVGSTNGKSFVSEAKDEGSNPSLTSKG